ncbi:MAG TPA: peptidoglycan DD-metalloendopeptidase family protein [Acidimicrobiia bacterium]|nr:peptidoglycan DD-metalloendopeptidase family protein [Acidimicrobiia bacterium]
MVRRIAVLASSTAFTAALLLGGPVAHAADDTATNDTSPRGRDPVSLAQQRLDEARGQATDIAGRISTAQTQQAKLEAEIADAETKIPVLRARATELRTEVKERAAQLYVRHGGTAAFESTMGAASAEDGLRAAHLTDAIGQQDLDAASELRETAEKLAARETELKQQRADLEKTIAALTPLNDLLQQKLQVASALYDKVHALVVEGAPKHGVDVATNATACPVKDVVVFTDDFGELRPGGPHPGIDMAAVAETPVVAVADGVWRHDVGGAGGNGVWLNGLDNVSYYYAHFSHYSDAPEGLIKAGEVIGFVGMTGNATGPHLHFEIHPGKPGENPPVDPFATLLALCDDNLPRAKATPN